jgi:hypothetical protein
VIKPPEYAELPELTDEMLTQAVVKKGDRRSAKAPVRRVKGTA